MRRIVTPLSIENILEPTKSIHCTALVDTGATFLTLPSEWKPKLGVLPNTRPVALEIATQAVVCGEVCGPVTLRIEGFDPVSSEVLFVEMQPLDGVFEPLFGYIPLEQSQAAVDMWSHKLVKAKRMDLK